MARIMHSGGDIICGTARLDFEMAFSVLGIFYDELNAALAAKDVIAADLALTAAEDITRAIRGAQDWARAAGVRL